MAAQDSVLRRILKLYLKVSRMHALAAVFATGLGRGRGGMVLTRGQWGAQGSQHSPGVTK